MAPESSLNQAGIFLHLVYLYSAETIEIRIDFNEHFDSVTPYSEEEKDFGCYLHICYDEESAENVGSAGFVNERAVYEIVA